MRLIIDSREKERVEQAKQYYTEQGLDVETNELHIGDFLFIDGDKKAVFEYKTISDFVASIQDNRVFNQINTKTIRTTNNITSIYQCVSTIKQVYHNNTGKYITYQ